MQKEKSAGLVQRISTAIMDLLIAFILSTVLSSFIVGPLFTGSERYKENYEVYESGLISTSLYIKDEHNSDRLTCVIDDVDEQGDPIFSIDNINVYDQILVNFYTNYSLDEVDKYQKTKANSSIYVLDNTSNNYVIDENAIFDDVYKFFAQSFVDATNFFFSNNETVKDAWYYLNLMSNYSLITSLSIALIICYIVVPLFTKKGETIGKKAFSLSLESIKNDKPLTKGQIILRESFYVLIVCILSYFTYLIPAIISLIFMIVNKNHLSLHDYVAQTYVIDNLKTQQTNTENIKENIIEAEVKEVTK